MVQEDARMDPSETEPFLEAFHFFTPFPPELQAKVWTYALKERNPRVGFALSTSTTTYHALFHCVGRRRGGDTNVNNPTFLAEHPVGLVVKQISFDHVIESSGFPG